MSGFSTFLKRVCVEPAVYWGNPKSNGRGGFAYDPPIEIQCFWNEKRQALSVNDGDKVISRALVYVLQDLHEEGLLYRGGLSELTTIQKATPTKVEDICIIKRFERYPGINKTKNCIYMAYLTPWLT